MRFKRPDAVHRYPPVPQTKCEEQLPAGRGINAYSMRDTPEFHAQYHNHDATALCEGVAQKAAFKRKRRIIPSRIGGAAFPCVLKMRCYGIQRSQRIGALRSRHLLPLQQSMARRWHSNGSKWMDYGTSAAFVSITPARTHSLQCHTKHLLFLCIPGDHGAQAGYSRLRTECGAKICWWQTGGSWLNGTPSIGCRVRQLFAKQRDRGPCPAHGR